MEEARKPFEYDEEKRGAILYFVAMVITVDVLGAIICIMQTDDIIKQTIVLNIGMKATGILFILFIPFVAVTCYKLKQNLVRISKIYLIARTIYMSVSVLIMYFHNMSDKTLIGEGKKYETFGEFTSTELLFPLGCVVLTSAAWFLYFIKSRRCKEIIAGQVDR